MTKQDIGETLSGDEAFDILVNHFMGENYYCDGPIHAHQANAYILKEIIQKYPKGKIRRIPKK